MATPVLACHQLSMQYDGNRVLRDVDLHINPNEIVGLIGENGAGKSTLMNILCGVTQGWTGRVELHGRTVAPRNYREAVHLGIGRVYQEQSLIPTLPIYENMFLGQEDQFRRFGVLLNRPQMQSQARAWLAQFGIEIDVTRLAAEFDFSTRQAVEIAKAACLSQLFTREMPLVLLDEPTSALTRQEIEIFFNRLRQSKARNSYLFVSHRLTELLELCDRIYVMKDGRVEGEFKAGEAREADLHELMVGRKREADYYHEDQQRTPEATIVLQTSALGVAGQFDDITLEVRRGEILGIAGVIGSGKSELGRVLAGIAPWKAGTLTFDGVRQRPRLFARQAAERIAYIPQERNEEGIILGLSITWNMSLAQIARRRNGAAWLVRPRREQALADDYIRRLRINTPHRHSHAFQLSGGNQQKVVMAKWMACDPVLMILDNPTRGMDAGAKEEIYKLLRQLAAQGIAMIMISDELLELIGMCNRILVMKDGRIRSVCDAPPHAKPTEKQLVEQMV